jgi:hypothetical protein
MQDNQHLTRPHARIPIGIVSAAALVACLLLGGIFAWVAWNMPLELRIFIGAAFAGVVAWIWAGVIVYLRKHDHKYLDADKVIGLTLAQRSQGLPSSITSLNYHDSHRIESAPALALPEPSAEIPQLPTFAQLLDQGQIGPGRPLILGYRADSGQAISGSWNDLYSAGVGGMTGSGKSWAIAFLAGQSAAAGARIILVDPHAGDPESLANRIAGLSPAYMCDVASTPSDIENALKLAREKLDNRRAGRGGTWPLLLICDEWTSMLRGKLGDLLTATALDYAEQGRKYGCFALLGAQAWQVDASGAVRDRLASHYILRTRGDQFRYQTGLRSGAAPEDTLTLPPGQAYFLSTRGELTKVSIPQMTHADILRLGTLVDAPGRSPAKFGFVAPTAPLTPISARAVTQRRHDGDTAATSAAQVATASQSPEAARALALLHEGRDLPAIVLELRNVKPKEGRRYMTALSEVTDLLRQATKREVQG